jgi:hypothetical protein
MGRMLTVGHAVGVALRMGRHKGEQFTPELLWLLGQRELGGDGNGAC